MATTLNPALIALIEKLGAALRPRPKKPSATEDGRRSDLLTDDGSGVCDDA